MNFRGIWCEGFNQATMFIYYAVSLAFIKIRNHRRVIPEGDSYPKTTKLKTKPKLINQGET